MIVQLLGGLGNQMFQWAFGTSVAAQRGLPIEFYAHPRIRRTDSHIMYALDAFDIKVSLVSHPPKEVFNEIGPGVFDSRILSAPPEALYAGYWQTEKYLCNPGFVRLAFARPKGLAGRDNQTLAEKIFSSSDSAFIHVRRGDYTNQQTRDFHGLMSLEYFHEGMNQIRLRFPDTRFFLFSDDIEWCKTVFNWGSCVFVNNNHWANGTAQWDLWLMSLCNRGGVISNSSFGWWGAWLGDTHSDRLVVAPKKWFQADVPSQDIVPERWLKI